MVTDYITVNTVKFPKDELLFRMCVLLSASLWMLSLNPIIPRTLNNIFLQRKFVIMSINLFII